MSDDATKALAQKRTMADTPLSHEAQNSRRKISIHDSHGVDVHCRTVITPGAESQPAVAARSRVANSRSMSLSPCFHRIAHGHAPEDDRGSACGSRFQKSY